MEAIMSNVHDILSKKGNTIWTVGPQVTVSETLRLMAEKNVGAVLVVDGKKLAGIFSERDYARHSAKRVIRIEEAPIKDMMTTKVITVGPAKTMEECMSIMTTEHIRHLPVIEGDSLIGLISIGDVVKQVIEDQKFSINQLERYVTGEAY